MADPTEDALKAFTDFLNSGDFDKFKKAMKDQGINLKTTNLEYKKMATNLQDLTDQINSFDEQLQHTEDSSKKIDLEKKKSAAEKERDEQYSAAQSKNRKEAMGKVTGALITGLAQTFTKAAHSILSGSDGFSTASGVLSSSFDIANGAAQAGSKALGTMGSAATASGKKWGTAVSIAADALSGLSSAVTDLAKAGISFLLSQTQKTISAFQAINRAGAEFAGGMREMRDTSFGSGLTLEQFSKVLADNVVILGRSGMTVTQAAKEIGMVGSIIKKSGIQQSLLNLGYSFEDQADMTAKVMASMNRYATPATRASAQEVADQTAEYAKNLKLISDLTGEDAKARAEKARQANEDLAFQGEVSKMSATQQNQLSAAMGAMTETEQKNLRERVITHGSVVNKEGAVLESLVNGEKSQGEQYYRLLMANDLTTKSVVSTQAQYSSTIRDSALGLSTTVGKAGALVGGATETYSKDIYGVLKQSIQSTEDNVKSASDNQKKAGDAIESSAITGAMMSSQRLQIEAQDLATSQLGRFNTAIDETIKAMEAGAKALGNIGVENKNVEKMSTVQKIHHYANVTGEAIVGVINSQTGGLADTLATATGGKTLAEAKEARLTRETAEINPGATPSSATKTAKTNTPATSSTNVVDDTVSNHLNNLSTNSDETNSLLREHNELLRRLLNSSQQIHNAVS